MRKINKAHCFFEQSGTFKNQFIRLGIPAEDYDIQNDFKETDNVIDLFSEIEKGYNNEKSVFDIIGEDDLIMAFFPCIYFETMQMGYYDLTTLNLPKESKAKFDVVLKRVDERSRFLSLLYKLFAICEIRKLKLIVENPATQPNFLLFPRNFIPFTFIDRNRSLRGDYFKKPTAYWFLNLKPTNGKSYKPNINTKKVENCEIKSGGGICNKERSMISIDYAYNFICDFILGKENEYTQKTLF